MLKIYVSDCHWCISNMILVTDYERKNLNGFILRVDILEHYGHTFNEDKLAMVSNLRIYVFFVVC